MPITDRWRRRGEETDIADLGPIQIMREAFRQFWTYYFHFVLIQLTLILPVVGFFAAVQNKLLVYHLSALPLTQSADGLLAAKSHDHGVSFLITRSHAKPSFFSSSDLSNPHPFHPVVLISLLATFAFEAAQGLSTSAVLLSVGFIYTGHKVSFFGILRSAIPSLWARLAVTAVYNVFVVQCIVLLEAAALLVLLRFESSGGIWIKILKVVVGGAFGLLDLFVGVVFGVALGVSVLEEAYGIAAFKKALKLLDGKGRVAIWFHVVWSRTVPSVITFALNHRGTTLMQEGIGKTGDYRSWSPTPLQENYLNTVLFVAWTTLFWELSSLCAGVQYVSFKAYHHESIADSRFFEERVQLGYQGIGDERHQVEAAAAAPAAHGDYSIESGATESLLARPDT